jgi:thioredoxin reductase (NADPH)
MYPAAAPRFRDREVVIVGGANSAGQAALHLAEHEANVTVLCRGETLDRSMAAYLTDRIQRHPQITVRARSEITAARGDSWLEEVAFRGPDGDASLRASALFVLIGGEPLTLAIRDWLRLDERGYLLTGPDVAHDGWPLERDPMFLETSQPGVFAAGDVRHGSIKRVASAVGDGAMAVSLVHAYLRGR